MIGKSIKQKLNIKQRINGCWIEMFSPIAAEIMAMSGYDVAVIDLEHGPGSYLEAISMMQALTNHGCSPLIRTQSTDPDFIKRVLDIGPMGIMVPNIRSADEASDMVAACRYRPAGIRGAAPTVIRGTEYGTDVDNYTRWMDSEFLLIGQVESLQAVNEIKDIANIDSLDMLFVGPTDLSASLGALGKYDSKEFIAAFKKIERCTLAAGKWLGTVPFPGWNAESLYRNGHHLVVSGADSLLLRQAALGDVETLRQSSSF